MIRFIQQAGQWAFLRLDRALNAAFGDRLNPLYHLGAIAYLMMWVVTATGLYLYIFFDTGIKAAYESVESITHGQWYLGQVMRGLHRYGSDAMVLAMGLHMLRHFLFDHYRSFRWFSWVSGVAVLWLVFASGINGFMLPWDRLAQYVTLASAELVDWLPIIAEPMARNFLREGSVNDRLFTLLVFMHIGIPLFALLVLWIHTQRVPKAETAPPRALTLPLLAALVLLSLVKPVLSQGPANLDTVVANLALDWFYLPLFPLIYAWSPKAVWLLLGGVTLLLVLLPWLPPKRQRKGAEYQMLARPGDAIATVRPGETLLEAGLRAGLQLPFECRSGGCGVCKCTVLQGYVDYGVYQAGALTEDERRAGKVLMCCATPLSDLEVECETVTAAADLPVRTFQARVEKLEPLAEDVMRLTLKPLVEEPIRFHAGQYLNIVLEDRERRAFSFAQAPHVSDVIELHVKLVPGGAFTTWAFNAMKPGDLLTCEGPLGRFTLREDSDRPIIFVAGSTGFAPVKSMVEYAFRTGFKRKLHFYWGVKSLKDMYLRELPERWAREHDNFTFVPVLSDPAPEDRWSGRIGNVHEAILQDFPDLVNCEVYACGSVGLVQAAHDAFRQQGMPEDRCFSDAFEFAPHIKSAPATGAVTPG
ncbi:MAG: 2Fe-2S iron-sulfur cluster binding domain-containing protein [Gammaproteobacteria bacterium]|nr:MAG: 2Fe-2S iron-sulfur cluster binding domain-containing protein [Gammaproteobacteria bacterium]